MALRKFVFAVVQRGNDPPSWGAWAEGTCPDPTQAALLREALSTEPTPGVVSAAFYHWCDPELAAAWLDVACSRTEVNIDAMPSYSDQARAVQEQWIAWTNACRAMNLRPCAIRQFREAAEDHQERLEGEERAAGLQFDGLWGIDRPGAFLDLDPDESRVTFGMFNTMLADWKNRRFFLTPEPAAGGLWGRDNIPTTPTRIQGPTDAYRMFALLDPVARWARTATPLTVVIEAKINVALRNADLLDTMYRAGRITTSSERELVTLLDRAQVFNTAARDARDSTMWKAAIGVLKVVSTTSAGRSSGNTVWGSLLTVFTGLVETFVNWVRASHDGPVRYYDACGREVPYPGGPAPEFLAVRETLRTAPTEIMPPRVYGWRDPYVAPPPQVCCPEGQGRGASGQCVIAPLPDTGGGGEGYYIAGMGLLVLAAGGFLFVASRRR